jgi:PTH1 family peptidyl-tRNA hydrolase
MSWFANARKRNLEQLPGAGNPWLVVGLGNPGPKYEHTRHNVGFLCVEELARRADVKFSPARGVRAQTASARLTATGFGPGVDAVPLVLVKPMTFMNESGQAVGALAKFHKVPIERIVVIHDELDIDFGRLRLKKGGGDNGHNGLKSVRAHLGSGEFFRVRIGIGRPPGAQDPIDYVLGNFAKSQAADLSLNIAAAADAVESLVRDGLETAQNRFNH